MLEFALIIYCIAMVIIALIFTVGTIYNIREWWQ